MSAQLQTATLAGLALCATLAAAAPQPVWIDVRTPVEFAAGHVPGAINIPYEHIAQHIGGVLADKTTPVYLYCRSGRRSGIALRVLQHMGYTQALNKGALNELLAPSAQEKHGR